MIESVSRQTWWDSDLGEFLDGRNSHLWNRVPELHKRLHKATSRLTKPISLNDSELDFRERVTRTIIRWCLENTMVMKWRHYDFLMKYEDLEGYPESQLRQALNSFGAT